MVTKAKGVPHRETGRPDGVAGGAGIRGASFGGPPQTSIRTRGSGRGPRMTIAETEMIYKIIGRKDELISGSHGSLREAAPWGQLSRLGLNPHQKKWKGTPTVAGVRKQLIRKVNPRGLEPKRTVIEVKRAQKGGLGFT